MMITKMISIEVEEDGGGGGGGGGDHEWIDELVDR